MADESLHITGAFQLAGYGGVIGTLWPVGDDLAATIAQHVYRALTANGSRPVQAASAARALHDAIQQVRQTPPRRPTAWSGHIHVGL
jgi:CHAT domain-containing protein